MKRRLGIVCSLAVCAAAASGQTVSGVIFEDVNVVQPLHHVSGRDAKNLRGMCLVLRAGLTAHFVDDGVDDCADEGAASPISVAEIRIAPCPAAKLQLLFDSSTGLRLRATANPQNKSAWLNWMQIRKATAKMARRHPLRRCPFSLMKKL